MKADTVKRNEPGTKPERAKKTNKRELSKCRVWERERRDRLKNQFAALGKLLPSYEPSCTLSKTEILQRAAQLIGELQQRNNELLLAASGSACQSREKAADGGVAGEPRRLELQRAEIQRLQERVKRLLERNEQLNALLQHAGIRPPGETGCLQPAAVLGAAPVFRRAGKWSGRITAEQASKLATAAAASQPARPTPVPPRHRHHKKPISISTAVASKKSRACRKRSSDAENIDVSNKQLPQQRCKKRPPPPGASAGCKQRSQGTAAVRQPQLLPPVYTSPSLGPGTLILADGSVLPVVQRPPPVAAAATAAAATTVILVPQPPPPQQRSRTLACRPGVGAKVPIPPLRTRSSVVVAVARKDARLSPAAKLKKKRLSTIPKKKQRADNSNESKRKDDTTCKSDQTNDGGKSIPSSSSVDKPDGKHGSIEKVVEETTQTNAVAASCEQDHKAANVSESQLTDKPKDEIAKQCASTDVRVPSIESSVPMEMPLETVGELAMDVASTAVSADATVADGSLSNVVAAVVAEAASVLPSSSAAETLKTSIRKDDEPPSELVSDASTVTSKRGPALVKEVQLSASIRAPQSASVPPPSLPTPSQPLAARTSFSYGELGSQSGAAGSQSGLKDINKEDKTVKDTTTRVAENGGSAAMVPLPPPPPPAEHSELSNDDIFASLNVAGGETHGAGGHHPESMSPTAAFLLAFPLVSTLTGGASGGAAPTVGSASGTRPAVDGAGNSPEDNSDSRQDTPTLLQIGTMDVGAAAGEPAAAATAAAVRQAQPNQTVAVNSEPATNVGLLSLDTLTSLFSASPSTYKPRAAPPERKPAPHCPTTSCSAAPVTSYNIGYESLSHTSQQCNTFNPFSDVPAPPPPPPPPTSLTATVDSTASKHHYSSSTYAGVPSACSLNTSYDYVSNFSYHDQFNAGGVPRKPPPPAPPPAPSRPPINWMTTPDTRSNELASALQGEYPAAPPQWPETVVGGNDENNRWSWSPGRLLPQLGDQHMAAGSSGGTGGVLPTLLGDLALGTGHDTSVTGKRPATKSASGGGGSGGSRKQQAGPVPLQYDMLQPSGGGFSVSQLVEQQQEGAGLGTAAAPGAHGHGSRSTGARARGQSSSRSGSSTQSRHHPHQHKRKAIDGTGYQQVGSGGSRQTSTSSSGNTSSCSKRYKPHNTTSSCYSAEALISNQHQQPHHHHHHHPHQQQQQQQHHQPQSQHHHHPHAHHQQQQQQQQQHHQQYQHHTQQTHYHQPQQQQQPQAAVATIDQPHYIPPHEPSAVDHHAYPSFAAYPSAPPYHHPQLPTDQCAIAPPPPPSHKDDQRRAAAAARRSRAAAPDLAFLSMPPGIGSPLLPPPVADAADFPGGGGSGGAAAAFPLYYSSAVAATAPNTSSLTNFNLSTIFPEMGGAKGQYGGGRSGPAAPGYTPSSLSFSNA